MITLNNLTMGFTGRTLFKDVSLSIFPNEKIGLTGPNGSGKTTLFSIILGEAEPLSGDISIQKNLNIGYLPQEAKFDSERTVIEELTEGDDRIRRLKAEKRKLEDHHKAATQRYGDVLEELEMLGIYELESRAEMILSGLGFKEHQFEQPVSHLSGGWQMRTLLAKLLTYPYDILLLDEPTNYLDLPATLWLKDFLKNYRGMFILISHDRVFLNDVTNYTIILDQEKIMKVKGNYEAYEQQRDVELKTLEKKKKVVDKKRKQLERFTQRFHAQPNRAAAVRNKRKQIERLENIELPPERSSIKDFEFPPIEQSGYVVTNLKNISKSYGDNTVYESLNFEVIRGQKMCLVGPNGAGKSTLLKILAGVLDPDGGEVKLGHNVGRGYFSQTRMDVLQPGRSAFDELMSSAPKGTPAQAARDLLGLFNFHGDDVFKLVKVLSGGEKSRLILAKLLIKPPNFLLLDEPTTHLDLDGVKALTKAFRKYKGTMVFISHDLYFIKQIADHIVDVKKGGIKVYPGGLDYYLGKTMQTESRPEKEENGPEADAVSGKKPSGGKKAKSNPKIDELHQKHKEAMKRKKEIKREIEALEKERKELETESYVKSRIISDSYQKRDEEKIKESGRRLKEIQKRLRDIESAIKNLNEEKRRISK